MKIILTPPDFDFRTLRTVVVDTAAVGSLCAVLTVEGVYIVHADRLDSDPAIRAMIGKLATEGLTAPQIARRLGITLKTAERHHIRPYASKASNHKARSNHARRNAESRPETEASSLRG